MFDLTAKVALVTGAGQNVGAGIARALAAQGAHVAVNDYVAERAEAVVADIVAEGGVAMAVPFDVTDLDAVVEAVAAVTAELGPIDICVNNAGNGGVAGMAPTLFRDMSPGEWGSPIEVNLRGVMNCCHAVIDAMCEQGWGRIITISSGAGTVGVGIGVAPYSAGKGGGLAFTRSLALEVARHGVTANTLAIGLMEMQNRDVTAALARTIPVGRTGRPDDIAAACVWLASEEASWVTAQTIEINGGSHPT
ncbi:MAG: SDR family NAD(P)-dependent oxidoreductase [Acidimicrobiales bacterium]